MIRVFLADDHAVVRDGLCSLLEAEGDIEVVGTAEDGREAVLRVEELRPDVALIDIAMPELNGVEAARQVHSVSPETRVVILSMHASKEHIFRALRAGAQGYVLKAAAGSEVVAAVRRVNAGHRFLSQRITDEVVEAYVQQRQGQATMDPLDVLSPREQEVLQLLVEGKTHAEIAEILVLSPKTVATYRSRLMRKLAIDDLPSLVKFAIRHGLTPLE